MIGDGYSFSSDYGRMCAFNEAVFGIPLYERTACRDGEWDYTRVGVANTEAAARAWVETGVFDGKGCFGLNVRPVE